MSESTRPSRASLVAGNSDLVGVASLLLILASPVVFAVGWTVAKSGVPELVGVVLYLGSLVLAIVVVATGRRGRAAGVATIAASVPIALTYSVLLVLRAMVE